MDRDLTTGPISGHFRALAIPSAIGMLFSTLYNVVDTYFAGQISTDAQAGMAIGFQAFFIMMAVGFGLGSALSALVGNAAGKKDMSAARRLALQGIGYGVIATILLMIASAWFGPALIRLVSEPGAYRDAGTGYFNWLVFSLPGFLLAYGANGILQARGDTKSLQRALMVAFFANCVLNPLFIYGLPGVIPGLGFNGIALATIVSQTGVAIYILRCIFKREMMEGWAFSELRPEAGTYKEITAQMAPTSFAILVMFAAGFVVQFGLKQFGGHAIAAYGIALRIEQLFLLPILGITGALLPIAAQNFGADQYDRVRDALFFCIKICGVMMIVACPILWFGGRTFMGFFTSDPAVKDVGALYLKIDGLILPVYMMLFAINSHLQALKKPIYTLWIGLYRQGFGIAFFIWLYIGVFDMDVIGVFLGIATGVTTGWLIAVVVAERVSRPMIGSLFGRVQAPKPSVPGSGRAG
ncbi:putative efflux protein, MATE family [Cognatiyoonia koreensis]|uniref:Putative efflux protein, MATE family n=1 Tax=Cognatiyoonia koreensis TaxID=364200 RepID=A0A1I0P3M3_9RHOB|nr:MATE family efflux transporter [Cognatiyoonia koreensis]SEW08962.1 putative efflux protein, MATE family [Cognatiyoonia koreensis]